MQEERYSNLKTERLRGIDSSGKKKQFYRNGIEFLDYINEEHDSYQQKNLLNIYCTALLISESLNVEAYPTVGNNLHTEHILYSTTDKRSTELMFDKQSSDLILYSIFSKQAPAPERRLFGRCKAGVAVATWLCTSDGTTVGGPLLSRRLQQPTGTRNLFRTETKVSLRATVQKRKLTVTSVKVSEVASCNLSKESGIENKAFSPAVSGTFIIVHT
jgi:hypothetical protein